MIKLADLLPTLPDEGPPLPKFMGIRWPGLSDHEITPGNDDDDYYFNPDGVKVSDEDILALHREGVPATEIGLRLNAPAELIRYRLRRHELEPIPAPRFIKAERDRAEVLRLHREDYSAKAISDELGVDLSRVYRIIREAELVPRASRDEIEATLERLGEILRLGRERVARYEIAKRTGSTWPLVAESLERSSVRRVSPACEELTDWVSSLSPIIEEIRAAHPDTKPIIEKANKLERELADIYHAAGVVERRLPWRGREADVERWCVANISSVCHRSLDLLDALRSCLTTLDTETLPRRIEQGRRCIENITSVMEGGIAEVMVK